MLWYKAWLEARFRLLFAVGSVIFFRGMEYRNGSRSLSVAIQGEWLFVALMAILLAGAGIITQPAFQATKGLHGSTLFTLSLPVTRLRLLTVRAALGWLTVVGMIVARCAALWFLFPEVKETVTLGTMVQHAATLIACSTGLYAIPVLLATFLDDLWRVQGSFLVLGALWYLFNRTPMPASVNLMRAMGIDSPMLAHTMPWAAMGFSILLGAVLFYAALKIVERREY